MDSGLDLRPKGRGRPQRILLGIWPDDHIKGKPLQYVYHTVHIMIILSQAETVLTSQILPYPNKILFAANKFFSFFLVLLT